MITKPKTPLKVNPQPGDVVLFKWRGYWTRGRVINTIYNGRRVIVQRHEAATSHERRQQYTRNATQIFEAENA